VAITFPTDDKAAIGSAFPEFASGTTQTTRVEPLLTPAMLRRRFFNGMPLVSPLDGKAYTDADLKDYILGAVGQVELDAQVDVTPVQRTYKLPFDRHLYQAWVHLEVPNKPILSVQELTITTADGMQVFKMPNIWIEGANFQRGILNVVPISPAFGAVGAQISGAQGGAAFLTFIGTLAWIPAYWQLKWVSGWPERMIPRVVNELIGCYAAIDILSMLASLHKNTATSLTADGLAQSVATPGPQVFMQRVQDLEMKKAKILKRIKTITGGSLVISNV